MGQAVGTAAKRFGALAAVEAAGPRRGGGVTASPARMAMAELWRWEEGMKAAATGVLGAVAGGAGEDEEEVGDEDDGRCSTAQEGAVEERRGRGRKQWRRETRSSGGRSRVFWGSQSTRMPYRCSSGFMALL